MKNEHILPEQVVPPEIRLEIYKEALLILKADEDSYGLGTGRGLCLLLPCILWDLPHYVSKAPNGEFWTWLHTDKMFPELTREIIESINSYDETYTGMLVTLDSAKDKLRIEVLKGMVESLEKELHETNAKTNRD